MAAFFIPVLWYFIGRRLERRTGLHTRPNMIGKVLMVAGLAVATLVAILIAVSLVVRFGELLAGVTAGQHVQHRFQRPPAE